MSDLASDRDIQEAIGWALRPLTRTQLLKGLRYLEGCALRELERLDRPVNRAVEDWAHEMGDRTKTLAMVALAGQYSTCPALFYHPGYALLGNYRQALLGGRPKQDYLGQQLGVLLEEHPGLGDAELVRAVVAMAKADTEPFAGYDEESGEIEYDRGPRDEDGYRQATNTITVEALRQRFRRLRKSTLTG